MHDGFLLFNPTNLRHAWSGVKQRCEAVEPGRGPDRVNLDPAVVLVTNPAREADFLGVLQDEPPKANSLDATGDEPTPGRSRGTAQCCCSSIMTGSMLGLPFNTSSTDSASRCRVNGFATNAKPFSIT